MFLAAVVFFGILTLWVEARWALTIFQVALLALAAASVVKRLRSGLPIGHHPLGLLLAGAAAWGLIQAAFGQTVYQLRTFETTLDWTVNLLAFSLALELGRQAKERDRFLECVLVFGAVLSLCAIFTILTSPAGKVFWLFDSSAGVATLGPFVYKNQYAAFVEAVLPVAMFRAIRNRRRWLPYTLIAALLFGSVVASGSRGGAVLCFLETLIVPVIAYAQKRFDSAGLARVLIGNLSLMGVLIAIVGWQTLWLRFEEPHPYALRRDLAQSSLQMLHHRPWTGFGLGTWSNAYPGYALFDDGTFVNQAHNDWVQWAAEGGIPFLMIVLATAAWTIRPAIRSVWGIGILAVFLHAVVDYPFQQRPALAAFIFTFLGLLAAELTAKHSNASVEDWS